jgi:hypothetical protein
MDNETAKKWDEARQVLRKAFLHYLFEDDENEELYKLDKLVGRHGRGERSEELYKEIMKYENYKNSGKM